MARMGRGLKSGKIAFTTALPAILVWGLFFGTTVLAQAPAAAPATAADPAKGDKILFSNVRPLGETLLITRTFQAEGNIRASLADEKTNTPGAPPMKLKVDSKVEYHERVAAINPEKQASRALRRLRHASANITGDVRPSTVVVRPKVATIVADLRGNGIFLFSNGGSFTRQELDLVRGPGDPMGWIDLFPAEAKAKGDSWKVGDATVRELSDYDALATHDITAVLESLDADRALIRFRGLVQGVARGGVGKIAMSGAVVFDRKANRVQRLIVNRNETRSSGQVEAALDMKSTLTLVLKADEVPRDLDNATLAGIPNIPPRDWEMLLYQSPGGKFTLRHDRDWHLYWDDNRLTVLKRLAMGELVAQCNVTVGPAAGPGRHQDLTQFQNDIKTALKDRFLQVIGQGELDAYDSGIFLYKLKVEGKEGQVGVIWDYYLAASPQGEQLLFTFTLGKALNESFADSDEKLVKTLEFVTDTVTAEPANGNTPKPAEKPAAAKDAAKATAKKP